MGNDTFHFDPVNLRERRMAFLAGGHSLLEIVGIGKLLEGPVGKAWEVTKAPFRLVRGAVRGGISDMFGEYPKKETGTATSTAASQVSPKEKEEKPGGNILRRNLTKRGRLEKALANTRAEQENITLAKELSEEKAKLADMRKEQPASGLRKPFSFAKKQVVETAQNEWKGCKRIAGATRNALGKVFWPVIAPTKLAIKTATYLPKKATEKHREDKKMNADKKDIREAAKAQMKKDSKVVELGAYRKEWEGKVAKHKAKEIKKHNPKPRSSLKNIPFSDKELPWRKAA